MKGVYIMNTNEKMRLPNCDNHYTIEEMYDRFGIDERETKKCMNCRNHRMEGGIITCKYILEGCDDLEEDYDED